MTIHRALTALTLASIWIVVSGVQAGSRPVTPVPDRFETIGAARRFARIVERVRDSNAPDLVGHKKWTSLVAKYRESIVACTTHEAFAQAVNHLIEESGVSHFHYYTSDDWSYWHVLATFGDDDESAHVAHVGIFPERIGDRWFVRGIFEGSPADRTRIRVGDELVTVDGAPFGPIKSFQGKEGQTVDLALRRKPTLLYHVEITPIKESLYAAMQDAILKSIRIIESDGHRFAYVHGWTLLGRSREYDKLTKLQDTVDGLLLDYRDGFGGTWGRALRFLLGRRKANDSERTNPGWRKPVVILTDDGTRSAKEIVVDAVQERNRAPLVGEPTPGHVISVGGVRRVGQDSLLVLPGEAYQLEGHPTNPDYFVTRDIPYCAGVDPQLEKAKEVLTLIIERQSLPRLNPVGR